MIRLGKYSWLMVLLAILATALNTRSATNSTPEFKEVYDLIRTHVTGLSETELNRAAVVYYTRHTWDGWWPTWTTAVFVAVAVGWSLWRFERRTI